MTNFTENVSSADNQQETLISIGGSSETTRETPFVSRHYLLGVLKDSTKTKYTYRISQKGIDYPKLIANSIISYGNKAWIYKEGKDRDVYIVEFSRKVLDGVTIKTFQNKIDYIKGYSDAEGGICKSNNVRPYIYFCQKNYQELVELKEFLQELKISSGKIHNPSKRVDSNYWRFYISTKSHKDFVSVIGSAHPNKSRYLRMMI